MSNSRDEQTLIQDSLGCFQAWLSGNGLTSPGVFATDEVLAAELARLEDLKGRVDAAIELVHRSDLIRAALVQGRPDGNVARAPQGVMPPPLDEQDLRRIRAALEVYIEESAALDLIIGASNERIVLSIARQGASPTQVVLLRSPDSEAAGG